MDKQDIRYTAASVLFIIGFLLIVGTFGKYEFNGFIDPGEFLSKITVGLLMIGAALPVSGDMDELFEQTSEKRKNRR